MCGEIIGTAIFMLSALSGNWLLIGLTLTVLLYVDKGTYNPGILLTQCAVGKKSWNEGIKSLGLEIIGVIIAIIIYKIYKNI